MTRRKVKHHRMHRCAGCHRVFDCYPCPGGHRVGMHATEPVFCSATCESQYGTDTPDLWMQAAHGRPQKRTVLQSYLRRALGK
jgi:hypothetical protein